jgi:hypothetical protein
VREAKVVTSESETAFEEKFRDAIAEVEARGKIVDIRFRTNAIPPRPNSANSARLYFTAFISFESSTGEAKMDSIK